jgi:hypothetical protein
MNNVPFDNITWLVGDGLPESRPLPPYSDVVCRFLGELSRALLRDRANREFSDVAAFAFFCRMSNIERLKEGFRDGKHRLGRGLAFHITPSNVPINFAFSLVFGLLAGNSNIVRVPTKGWPQVGIVCGAVRELLAMPEYSELGHLISMARYERDDEITGYFSSRCDARVIWGGDGTVLSVRKIPIPPRCVELTFADRYSCCAISADAVMRAGCDGLKKLADAFYNDTFLIDQNACSSPTLRVWLGDRADEAKERFWAAVERSAARYRLEPAHATEKYTLLCEYLASSDDIRRVRMCGGNLIYRAELGGLGGVEGYRGRFGIFFEYSAVSIEELAGCVSNKWQTLTYYGLDAEEIASFVTGGGLAGIDRIVPVGAALDIGVIWDGCDIISALSRIVSF